MLYSISHMTRKDHNLPIRLVYLGYFHELEATYHPQGTDFFLLYFCTQGTGEFITDGQASILQAGQLFLSWPHVPLSCKSLSDDCSTHLVGFTGACCDQLLSVCNMEESGIYQIDEELIFSRYITEFVSCYKQNASQIEYSKLCYGLLVELAPHTRKLKDVPTPVSDNETVKIVIEYLETHYREQISLDMIADSVHLSKEYLCTLFKKEMHRTILEHLTIIRIGWARMYLEQYPEKRVYEIGKMCGFESASYFGKKFLKLVGVTPENYRHVNSIVL